MGVKPFIKAAFTALGILLILIGVLAILLIGTAGRIAKDTIGDALSEAFTTPIDYEAIILSPAQWSAEIRGFSVANPKNFKEGPAIECGLIRIEFEPTTLFSKSPVIRHLLIEGADLYYRHEAGEGTNIGQLAEDAENQQATTTRRVIIRHLRCEDAKVHFSTNLIPKTRINLPLVTIDLENIHDNNPITTRQATAIFLRSALLETVTLKSLLKPLVNSIRRRLGRLPEENERN